MFLQTDDGVLYNTDFMMTIGMEDDQIYFCTADGNRYTLQQYHNTAVMKRGFGKMLAAMKAGESVYTLVVG